MSRCTRALKVFYGCRCGSRDRTSEAEGTSRLLPVPNARAAAPCHSLSYVVTFTATSVPAKTDQVLS